MPKKIVLAVVIAAIAVAGYFIYENFLKGFGFAIPDGLEKTYNFSIVSDAGIDTGVLKMDAEKTAAQTLTGKGISVKTSSKGYLSFKFYKNGRKGWNVAARLANPEISINGQAPGWVWALSNPFSFRMDIHGAVSGFMFTPGLPAEAEAFMSNLVYKLQTVLPEKQLNSWVIREADEYGEAEMSYSVVSWDVKDSDVKAEKKKLRIINLAQKNSAIPFLSDPSMKIIKSSAGLSLSLKGWVSQARGEQSLAFFTDGRQWSKSQSSFSFSTTEEVQTDFPVDFKAFSNSINSQTAVENVINRTDPVLNAASEGLSISGALEKYIEMSGKDKNYAERFLVNYLKKNPSSVYELLHIIDSDSEMKVIDEKTQLILWRLIIESGTDAAQKAVMKAAADPTFSRLSHLRAILYGAGFENPQPFMVEVMLKLHLNPVIKGDEKSARIIENMSLLAVGSMGFRDRLNNETKELAAKELSGNLKRSKIDSAEISLTLKAIGNTGNPELISTVRPYLSNSDVTVRSAAANSLRRMDVPEAQKLLVNLYDKDDSVIVREQALKSLIETPVTKESASWARESVLKAETPNETALIIDILGKTMKTYPENEAALRKLIATNPPIGVKETVYKYIAP